MSTVRVRRPDSERWQTLAKALQTTVIDVLPSAIEALKREDFLRGVNSDLTGLRRGPDLWKASVAEREEWDALA